MGTQPPETCAHCPEPVQLLDGKDGYCVGHFYAHTQIGRSMFLKNPAN
jgi:hypothetical protein